VVDHEEIKDFMDAMTMGYNAAPSLPERQARDNVRSLSIPKRAITKEKLKQFDGRNM
jgi:hypothetical protein